MIENQTRLERLAPGKTIDRAEESQISLLEIMALLVERRRFIVRFVLGAVAVATIIAFLLPVRYEARTVLLPPAQNSSLGSALFGQLGNLGSIGSLSPLASLAGGTMGIKNPADMYVSFLTGRTVEDAIIQRFGLMNEFHKSHISDARKELERRTTVTAGTKDGLIRISVEDRDPKRAAELANGYVEEFRRLSASLAVTEAARRRLFFEQQLLEAKNSLNAAEDAMTKTQQSTGVLQIDSQARSLIESAAALRAQVVAKQVQIEAMRSFATEDNPELILAKQQLAALQEHLQRVAGSDRDLGTDINLSKGRVTESGMEYLRRYRDLKYQETVFELIAKELEVAKLDEAREGSAIQVVDAAIAPDRRSSPHRLLIVIGTLLFAFFSGTFWVWFKSRLSFAFELPQNKQQLRTIRTLWHAPRTRDF